MLLRNLGIIIGQMKTANCHHFRITTNLKILIMSTFNLLELMKENFYALSSLTA